MKISIITATYNSGATIRDTIKSVLSQNYSDFEHIIVDGGSKDKTIDIIKDFESQYKGRLKWISEPDKGIYDAMNKGIQLSTGDVIGILNSDDYFTSDTILDSIAKNITGVDAVYGDIHFIDSENPQKCVRYYSSKNFAPWKMRFGYMPAHPSFYCWKKIYDKFGDYDLDFPIGADYEMLVRLLLINRIKAQYIPLDCVTMRTGGVSSSGIKSHHQISKDILKALKKNNVRSNIIFVSFRYTTKTIDLIKSKFTKNK